MIPVSINEEQKLIVEFYWNKSWMFLTAMQVQEALDWWNAVEALDRYLNRGERYAYQG